MPSSSGAHGGGSWVGLVAALVGRCLLRPWIIPPLLLVGWRFRRRRWYARAPFLPLPAWTYVQWRMHTAYGSHEAVPPVDDVINYARWSWRLRQ